MVSKDKGMKYIESKWAIRGFLLLSTLISILYGITQNLDSKKADKEDLCRVEKKAEENTNFNHRLEVVLKEVETLLKERTK